MSQSIMISGICGFVGSSVARWLLESRPDLKIFGFDNFSRPGSHVNQTVLDELGIKVFHADVRLQSDLEFLPRADWVVDACANPSVLAGCDGVSSSRQVVENNLLGTVNLLEYARKHGAGLIFLSSSRVYSIGELQKVPLKSAGDAFVFDDEAPSPSAVSAAGITEAFCTASPISLYGASKLSSEILALEYAESFNVPVWINRCGVLAGAGQFGRPDQGIFAYWINAYRARRPLSYIGFGGSGHQVRDCLHPRDLAALMQKQMDSAHSKNARVCNVGGGAENSMSLSQISQWCAARFGRHEVTAIADDRKFDVPWIVMDCALAARLWQFRVATPLSAIMDEIADHARHHPEWLKVSAV